MTRTLLSRLTMILLAAVLALSACSSSDDESSEADSSDTTAAISDDTTSDDTTPDDTAAESDEPSGEGYTAEDEGNGTVTANGTTNEGFVGECEISRNVGREDVGDISIDDVAELEIILAIDNVDSNPAEEMNYLVTGSTGTFRAANIGNGNLTGIAYAGDTNTLTETSEIGLVSFTGTTDEGTEVSADVVCVIQNAFS